jgi:hypothetical protein
MVRSRHPSAYATAGASARGQYISLEELAVYERRRESLQTESRKEGEGKLMESEGKRTLSSPRRLPRLRPLPVRRTLKPDTALERRHRHGRSVPLFDSRMNGKDSSVASSRPRGELLHRCVLRSVFLDQVGLVDERVKLVLEAGADEVDERPARGGVLRRWRRDDAVDLAADEK